MTKIHPTNMNKSELRAWAKELCDQWNWNAGVVDIVEHLSSEGIYTESREFQVLGEEFNKFFNQPVISQWEVIRNFLEQKQD